MKIIFNGAKELPIDTYRENVSGGTLNASLDLAVTETTHLPDLTPFRGMTEFDSVAIVSDGAEMPIVCEYNRLDITATFSDDGHYYHLNVALHRATE